LKTSSALLLSAIKRAGEAELFRNILLKMFEYSHNYQKEFKIINKVILFE